MKSFSNILFVSDLDGTLLDQNCNISPQNTAALETFVQQGGLFTIATGRMETSIRRYIDLLPINLPVILYNGASIYNLKTRSVEWKDCIEEDLAAILMSVLQNYPQIAIEFFHAGKVYVVNPNQMTDQHCQKDGIDLIHCELENVPTPWYKIILVGEHEQLKSIQKQINARITESRTLFTEPQFLELLHKNASKGKALNELKQLYSIKQLFTVTIGDGMNDLELIQAAELGLSVSNAATPLKQQSQTLKSSHQEHAMIEALSIIQQIKAF